MEDLSSIAGQQFVQRSSADPDGGQQKEQRCDRGMRCRVSDSFPQVGSEAAPLGWFCCRRDEADMKKRHQKWDVTERVRREGGGDARSAVACTSEMLWLVFTPVNRSPRSSAARAIGPGMRTGKKSANATI